MCVADIYRKVKTGQRPYFRPTLHNSDEAGLDDELANMVRKCWSEDALERPDFPALKTIIRKINKCVLLGSWFVSLTLIGC